MLIVGRLLSGLIFHHNQYVICSSWLHHLQSPWRGEVENRSIQVSTIPGSPTRCCSETALATGFGRRFGHSRWHEREGIAQLLRTPFQVLPFAFSAFVIILGCALFLI